MCTQNGSVEVGTWPPQHTTRVYCLGTKTGAISFISSFFADGMTATCGRGFFLRRFGSGRAPVVVCSYVWPTRRESPDPARRGFIQCTSRRQHERCCASAHQSVAPDARGLRWGFAHRRLPNHDLASAAIVSCAAAGYARPFLRGGGTRYSPFECTHGRAHTLPLVGAALHAWYTIKSLGCLRSHAGDQRRHLSPV